MSELEKSTELCLPGVHEFADDLTRLSLARCALSLVVPFAWIALYLLFATWGYWAFAIGCLVCLSFVTYGSVSHDLVHGNLGLPRWANNALLSLIELLAIRSGHAYRMAHLHHHAHYPHEDDIEGAAAKMPLWRALFEGVVFQFRIWAWAMMNCEKERRIILLEGVACVLLVLLAIALIPVTPIFAVYAALMIMGSWIIPLVTSYLPHNPSGESELTQTRMYRGKVASVIAVEHLYHLEHHLYPMVPHHHWPKLATRLDPYFERAGIKPIKFWF